MKKESSPLGYLVCSQKSVCHGYIISCMQLLLYCDYFTLDIQQPTTVKHSLIYNYLQDECMTLVENFNTQSRSSAERH